MMKVSYRGGIMVASALFGLSTAAMAAPPAPATPVAARAAETPKQKTEQRIADLHKKLDISAAQQPQWDAFTAVMRDNAETMEATFDYRLNAVKTMNAAENMRSYAEVAMDHAQEVQKLVPVFDALYATMSDTQKHTADQVFRMTTDKAHHG